MCALNDMTGNDGVNKMTAQNEMGRQASIAL